MDFLKVMDNIFGKMDQCIKEISSRDLGMDMVFGEVPKEQTKHTKAIIC